MSFSSTCVQMWEFEGFGKLSVCEDLCGLGLAMSDFMGIGS